MGWLLAIKIVARRITRHGSDNGCEKKLIRRVRLHLRSSLRFKSIAQRRSSIHINVPFAVHPIVDSRQTQIELNDFGSWDRIHKYTVLFFYDPKRFQSTHALNGIKPLPCNSIIIVGDRRRQGRGRRRRKKTTELRKWHWRRGRTLCHVVARLVRSLFKAYTCSSYSSIIF